MHTRKLQEGYLEELHPAEELKGGVLLAHYQQLKAGLARRPLVSHFILHADMAFQKIGYGRCWPSNKSVPLSPTRMVGSTRVTSAATPSGR